MTSVFLRTIPNIASRAGENQDLEVYPDIKTTHRQRWAAFFLKKLFETD
jgi:hypothetical protein